MEIDKQLWRKRPNRHQRYRFVEKVWQERQDVDPYHLAVSFQLQPISIKALHKYIVFSYETWRKYRKTINYSYVYELYWHGHKVSPYINLRKKDKDYVYRQALLA